MDNFTSKIPIYHDSNLRTGPMKDRRGKKDQFQLRFEEAARRTQEQDKVVGDRGREPDVHSELTPSQLENFVGERKDSINALKLKIEWEVLRKKAAQILLDEAQLPVPEGRKKILREYMGRSAEGQQVVDIERFILALKDNSDVKSRYELLMKKREIANRDHKELNDPGKELKQRILAREDKLGNTSHPLIKLDHFLKTSTCEIVRQP